MKLRNLKEQTENLPKSDQVVSLVVSIKKAENIHEETQNIFSFRLPTWSISVRVKYKNNRPKGHQNHRVYSVMCETT